MTTLTTEQRIERLRVRLGELAPWLAREHRDLDDWTFEGERLPLGGSWPIRRDEPVRLEHPRVTLPDDWPQDESELELNPGGEGLLEVRYEGDVERFGVDPYHERFPLEGRSFSLSLEAVPRLPFGVPNPRPRLERARLVRVDRELEAYVTLQETLLEAARSLGGHEVLPMLLGAAERSVAQLVWPTDTPSTLARLQGSYIYSQMWHAPTDLERHPRGLSDDERASVRAAREALERELEELRGRYPAQGRLLVSGHAHIDLAWLWPLAETRRKVRRTFWTALGLMERYDDVTFDASSAQMYADLEEDDPALLERIGAAVRAGRWEPIGGMWVESDANMPSGEGFVRQLLYGQRHFERMFGHVHTVGWLPDCFGFTPALPQLYAQAGITGFFTTKTNWNETNRFPHDLFWWEGSDGTRLLTHTFFNRRDAYNGVLGPEAALEVWRGYRGKEIHPEGLLTVGFGDGGGGMTREMLERGRAMARLPVVPEARFGRVDEYFERLQRTAGERALPVWTGEIYLELHRGTLTTQGRTKRLYRRAERDLVAAEVASALAFLLGSSPPASLERSWRVLLRNAFHDILPGSSIREAYEDAERELGGVVEDASSALGAALDEIASRLGAGGGANGGPGLIVVNPDLNERPLRVVLPADAAAPEGAQATEDGFVLATAGRVAGVSANAYARFPSPGRLEATERRLENAFVRVTLDEHGRVASLFDLRLGREALSGPVALWAYADRPRNWDAWDIDEDYAANGEELTELESIELVEEGPHRAAVRVTRSWRGSRIVQDVRLWANSARVEFRTRLAWSDRKTLLKVRAPLAVRSDVATYETAFGVVRRPTHRNTPWDAARFEVAGHRFADLSEPGFGVALLNDGRYGHHAGASELGLSLLRSPVWPDARADEGEHEVVYALLPHAGDLATSDVLAEAEDLNRPLLAHCAHVAEDRSFTAVRASGVRAALGTLKASEDEPRALVLRVYEPFGARGELRLEPCEGWRPGALLDGLERPQAPAGEREDGRVFLTPFRVQAVRLERTDA